MTFDQPEFNFTVMPRTLVTSRVRKPSQSTDLRLRALLRLYATRTVLKKCLTFLLVVSNQCNSSFQKNYSV